MTFLGLFVVAVISFYFHNWYIAHLLCITVEEPFSLIGPDRQKAFGKDLLLLKFHRH